VAEIVGKLGPPPKRDPTERMMTAREVIAEQKFRAWVAAGRPGSGRKKRILRAARRRKKMATGYASTRGHSIQRHQKEANPC